MDDDNRNAIKPCPATLAVEKLTSLGYLHKCCKPIQIEFDGNQLILCGQVSSFHLKQLAQETLRELKIPICNSISVVRRDDSDLHASCVSRK